MTANPIGDSRSLVTDRISLTDRVKAAARDAGFDLVGIAPAVSPTGFNSLVEWLERGFAGEMNYLSRRSMRVSFQSRSPTSIDRRSSVVIESEGTS